MKNKKGFTLVELIIVIAILAVIMLIGTAAYSSIQERMKVRADKATAGQIGKAIKIRETDVGEENGIGLYPEVIEYDEIPGIENYIAKEIKPQSMEDGNFVATAFQTQTGKKIVVGIGKKVEGETNYSINGKVYNKKDESGWAWSEDVAIDEFLKDESVSGTIGSGGTGTGGLLGETVVDNTTIKVGAYVEYIPAGSAISISGEESGTDTTQTFTPTETTKWRVLRNNNGQLDIISAGSVGNLELCGALGYANSVGILKDICSAYANGKYTTMAIPLGYESGTAEHIDVYKSKYCEICNYHLASPDYNKTAEFWKAFLSNDEESMITLVTELNPCIDLGWYKVGKGSDIAILKKFGYNDMWIASRVLHWGGYGIVNGVYNVCTLDTYNDIIVNDRVAAWTNNNTLLASQYAMEEEDPYLYFKCTNGVYPVVSLISGIELYGVGSLDSPYQIK